MSIHRNNIFCYIIPLSLGLVSMQVLSEAVWSKGVYPGGVVCSLTGKQGKLQVTNSSSSTIKVSLWDPDSGSKAHSFKVPSSTSVGPSLIIEDDWGVQIGSGPIQCINTRANFDSLDQIFRMNSK